MHPSITLHEETKRTAGFRGVGSVPCSYFDQCSETVAVAPRSLQIQRDPMISRRAAIAQQKGAISYGGDNQILITVIVEIANSTGTGSDFAFEKRSASLVCVGKNPGPIVL